MKILVVSRYFYPSLGGGEIVLWQILTGLAQKGHQVYVVTSQVPGSPDHEIINGIEIFRPFDSARSFFRGLFFSIRLFSYLKNFLKKNPVDIVMNGAYSCTIPAAWAARRMKIPSITYVTYYYGKNWFKLVNPLSAAINYVVPVITLYLSRSDVICCPSKMVSEQVSRYSRSKTVVIPSPIDTDEIQRVKDSVTAAAMRTRLGINPDEQFLVYVGRLSPEKNILNLLKTLNTSDLRYQLYIVGEGPERNKIESLIDRLKLDGRVKLTGRKSHEETLAFMKACDALLLPSKTEVFPTVVLEALTLEKPVIATRVGGVAEMQSDNLHLIDRLKEINSILLNGLEAKPDPLTIKRYSLGNIVSSFEGLFKSTLNN